MALAERKGVVSENAFDFVSLQERHFIAEYLIDLNASRAGRAAGYADHNACSGWLADDGPKPYVAKAVRQAMLLRIQDAGITADRILLELAKIGFANIADYLDVSDPNQPRIDLTAVERDKMAALSEVATETVYEDRPGGEKAEVRRVRIKMWDKPAALVNLGKHIGMFKTNVSLDVKGHLTTDGTMSAREQIRERMNALAEKRAAARAMEESNGPPLIEGTVNPEPSP